MLRSKGLTEKILLLGIDGMDPRFTRKMVDEGKMPHVKQLIDRGACREDLMLLGGVPTITPPMWTTLATGAYPMTHGVTDFNIHVPGELDLNLSGIYSKYCKAEQLWNVTAEAGKKTLIWHWPGASWPPSSKSANLHVVDGTSPGSLGMMYAARDGEFLLVASTKTQKPAFFPYSGRTTQLSGDPKELARQKFAFTKPPREERHNEVFAKHCEGLDFNGYRVPPSDLRTEMLIDTSQMDGLADYPASVVLSPIEEANGWVNAPADAKEFTLLLYAGNLTRPCLILKNAQGIYDKLAIYQTKEDADPLKIIEKDVFTKHVYDSSMTPQGVLHVYRNMRALDIAEDGSFVKMWVSGAVDCDDNSVWHPKSLFQDIKERFGPPVPTSLLGGQDPNFITKCNHAQWEMAAQWQADCLKYMMDEQEMAVIFSHYHGPDLQGHTYMKYLKDRDTSQLTEAQVHQFAVATYQLTDHYIGQFLPYLDKGWTILLFSDHALICPENRPHFIGDNYGVNAGVLKKLGYTTLIKDENGQELPLIDWANTKAVQQRSNSIYINLKGRDAHGIVDLADQYDLEEEIITALYAYTDATTGHRVVSLALHNKDAILLGLGGADSADIIFFIAENYNFDHGESLSTATGYDNTSTSPIFIAAGKGIKEGHYTTRYIREVDVAPTAAILLGVELPKDCEGAPAYQILSESL